MAFLQKTVIYYIDKNFTTFNVMVVKFKEFMYCFCFRCVM